MSLLLPILLFCTFQVAYALSLVEQFKHIGYLEICENTHGTATFDVLYASFDEFINFLHSHPVWVQKLYSAKERFIRSKEKHYYVTDFCGFYDASERDGRSQISFYYSIHFHEFIRAHYPEFNEVPEINRFLDSCCEIQKPYGEIFVAVATEVGLEAIFASDYGHPPILLKIVKYLPEYRVTRPHYDGTVFSLFLDSTDNEALLLSPYKTLFTVDDFATPRRTLSRGSVLLIPGTLLAEFKIYPTPHIVISRGTTRYATIAFAMRPHYLPQKNEFYPLPNFNIE